MVLKHPLEGGYEVVLLYFAILILVSYAPAILDKRRRDAAQGACETRVIQEIFRLAQRVFERELPAEALVAAYVDALDVVPQERVVAPPVKTQDQSRKVLGQVDLDHLLRYRTDRLAMNAVCKTVCHLKFPDQ